MVWRVILACVIGLVAATAHAQTTRPLSDLPMVPATSLSSEHDIVLTVPLTDAALQDAAAEAFAEDYGLNLTAIWPLSTIEVVCYIFTVPQGGNANDIIAELASDPRVVTVSAVQSFELLNASYDDELVPVQHALEQIRAVDAHAVSTGSDVTVAVIDSGVAVDHADLMAQGILYHNFVDLNAEAPASEPHGTAIAALIIADDKNAAGMVGVAPDVELLALRACWTGDAGTERCNSFSLARALNFAITHEVDIINLSLGGPRDPLLADMIEEALARGILVVAAHGPMADPAFPAAMPGVIAARAAHRSPGQGVAAPGLEVISAKPNGSYDFFSGDSVATAHVTGVAALMMSHRRDLDAETVTRALQAVSLARSGDPMIDACMALNWISASDLCFTEG